MFAAKSRRHVFAGPAYDDMALILDAMDTAADELLGDHTAIDECFHRPTPLWSTVRPETR